MKRAMMLAVVIGFVPACVVSAASVYTASARVTPAASAAEQIGRASSLWQEMERTPPPRKIDLFAQAWSNLAIVRKAWPGNADAVVRSGMMQADLAAEFGLWRKAIEPLTEILPAAAKTNSVAQVERRLGYAYEQAGDAASAEQHLIAAQRAMSTAGVGRVESEAILSSLAHVYARENKPAEAMRLLHDVVDLPGQDAVNKVTFQLYATEQALRVSNQIAAQELARLDNLITAARGTTLTARQATLVNHATQQAKRMRHSAHL